MDAIERVRFGDDLLLEIEPRLRNEAESWVALSLDADGNATMHYGDEARVIIRD